MKTGRAFSECSIRAFTLLLSVVTLGNMTVDAAPPQWNSSPSPHLQAGLDKAVAVTLKAFEGVKLAGDELAVTVVDLREPDRPAHASVRGDEPIYPASVVKLFYLAAAHQWLEDGRLTDTPELRRAMSDMIVHSYNEATHYVIDLLTGTTSGPELPEPELAEWFDKRNAVNRHFTALGYARINANKKPWCEGPYGRETQAIQKFEPRRNMLTTDASARLLGDIATGRCVNHERSRQMMELLRRDAANGRDEQAQFTGPALPPGARLWSKAGWTSQARHDAVYVEMPGGAKFVLVVFTVNHANEREIIPTLTRELIAIMKW